MVREPSARLAVVVGHGPGWPPGGPGAAAWGGATLLDRALGVAREFDPEPIVLRLDSGADGRQPWLGAVGALRATGLPVVLLAVELPLVPRVWLDYLRRLAMVRWPGGRRAPGSPAALLPLTERGPEAGAGLFHPDALALLETALATDWDGRCVPPGLDDALMGPNEWQALAGADSFWRCSGPADLARAWELSRAGEGAAGAGVRAARGSADMAQGLFTHLDEAGRPRLVDVGAKPISRREATAAGSLILGQAAFAALVGGTLPKGDALVTARLAAIQAVKRTAEAIPLCHPLPIDAVDVAWETDAARRAVSVRVTVRASARTGVEMEALHGAALFLLTVYDMAKAVDRSMTITDLRLLAKSGGRGGDYRRAPDPMAGTGGGGKEPA